MPGTLLERMSDAAFAALDQAGGDPANLSEPYRTIVLIYSAQGVLDNGGFQYFFESDFPGIPSYSVFVDAYRRIDAHEAAAALESALAIFPPASQHLGVERRRILADKADFFSTLDSKICGDEKIWSLLAEFAARNAGSSSAD